jgi:3-hydroxy-9,10-secoandrosta-1,3,5(10)-triene-9,17-dione monooxygenase reductase component
MNARADHALEGTVPLVDTADLRRALGSFPTGVTIVTTLDETGALQGLTANAFSAVSLEPPLVLLCVGHNSRCYKIRGYNVSWHVNERGLPILDRYVAIIECALHAEHHGGDHAILLGRVEAISQGSQDARPLLYHRGRLLRAQALPD